MPKRSNYELSVIYQLIIGKDTYVGSAINLNRRLYTHKWSCVKDVKNKLYDTIRENGGWENVSHKILEKCDVEDEIGLLKREQYWMDEVRPTLNNSYAKRTIKEWRAANKEHLAEYDRKANDKRRADPKKHNRDLETKKKYYAENREKRIEQNKETYVCDRCKKELTKTNSAKHEKVCSGEYDYEGEAHQKLLAQKRESYARCSEKDKVRKNEKIPCVECGKEVRRGGMSRHLKLHNK